MDDTQAVTFRLDREVYENLRREAFETRRAMNDLVNESLAARYAGRGKAAGHLDGDPRNNDPANLVITERGEASTDPAHPRFRESS